jgi:hypothetical protein
MIESYRGYRITYWMKPIPFRGCDFDFAHVDYDGPEDNRCGNAASITEAREAIDELIDEGDG